MLGFQAGTETVLPDITGRRAAPPRPGLRPDLVIPCHNDADGLTRLLARARRLGCFARIIVVDDGSDRPVADVITDPGALTILHHEAARGGGVARNAGLAAVTAPHVVFADADDMLLPELPDLLADLEGAGPFDICQFRYAESRVAGEGLWGQPEWDERFWAAAGAGVGTLADLPRAHWPTLAQTANYPWNKVYDVGFLRRHGIGCAETAVHQDIPLHWLSYLAADRVLVSDRICAWHGVHATGDRLTNRARAERLEVFAALDPVARRALGADPAWEAAFLTFALDLVDWGAGRIRPDLVADLRSAERDWLARHVRPALPRIEARDPGLAARLAERIG